MVARFDPIAEVTLDELRVELMYPLDQAAERFFRNRQKPTPSTQDTEPAVATPAG
jgi:hypothetical protein